MSGGAGNDVLHGRLVESYGDVAGRFFNSRTDDAVDAMDGGSGNDRLFGGNGDIMSGGEDTDSFTVYFSDTAPEGTSQLGAATITDFEPGSEKIALQVQPRTSLAGEGNRLMGQVTVNETAEGHSEIMIEGEVVLVVENAVGLTIAINPSAETDNLIGSSTGLFDNDGNSLTLDEADVVVSVYFDLMYF